MRASGLRMIGAAVVALAALAGSAGVASEKVVYERDRQIWVAGNEGGSERRLTTGTAPAPSPDGRWIAFVRPRTANADAISDLFVVPTRGGRARRLLNSASDITWDPASRVIVSEGDRGLVRVGPHMRRARPIGDIWDTCGTSFAPDGRLAVATCGLVLMYDRTLSEDSARESVSGARQVLWGRGGFAYAWWGGDAKAGVEGPHELRLVPPGGRRVTLLATGTEIAAVPVAWSADGRRLLAQAGKAASVITPTPRFSTAVSAVGTADDLSDDGRTVLVSRPDGLHGISVEDGRDQLIAVSASAAKYISPPRPPKR